jgi:electron transfer flavoprotein alpha subunit
MTILVIAEHDNTTLKPATLNAVTAARDIGGDITVLVAGSGCGAVATAAAQVAGVGTVLCADHTSLQHFMAEAMAPVIVSAAAGMTHIIAPTTTTGKNVLPRAAALLDVQMISDVMRVVAPDTFVRPIYAGNALATVQSGDTVKVMTIRPTNFAPAAATGGSAAVKPLAVATPATPLSRFVGQEVSKSERPELTAAKIVVSGGRGVGSAENFKIIEALADAFIPFGGAAVGASRAAVDGGFAPNDYQVGQTGKVVAPELYVAVGISGAIQHLAGMKDSKFIAAINKDPEAPIFSVADYGLVADLFVAAPELAKALKA